MVGEILAFRDTCSPLTTSLYAGCFKPSKDSNKSTRSATISTLSRIPPIHRAPSFGGINTPTTIEGLSSRTAIPGWLNTVFDIVKGRHPRSPWWVPPTLNRGMQYLSQGRYLEAERTLRQVSTVRRTITRGPDHPQTLESDFILARSVYLQGRYVDAENMFADLLSTQLRVLGKDHPSTLRTKHGLALSILNQGPEWYGKAEHLFQEAFRSRLEVLGETHEETLESYAWLAFSILVQGRRAEAELMYRKLLEKQRSLARAREGGGDPDVSILMTMQNLALAIARPGRYAEAAEISSQVVKGRRKVLGEAHPDTVDSVRWFTEQEKLAREEMAYRPMVSRPKQTHAAKVKEKGSGWGVLAPDRSLEDTLTLQVPKSLMLHGRKQGRPARKIETS